MPTIQDVRAQYPQYSDMSDAQLADALHSKFYADMPRAQFDEKVGLKPDKYKQTAIEERDALKAQGVDTNQGVVRRILQGATFNTADEIMAAAETPLEMIRRRTLNPAEAYRYTKAAQDLSLEDARKSTGTLGTIAEIGGGVMSGAGLAGGGLTTAARLAPNAGLGARVLSSAADGALYGAAAGAGEGNSLAERGGNALQGGLLGGLVGGAVPAAVAAGQSVVSPLVSNIRARVNPVGFAQSQVARAISESGRPVADIAADVGRAAQEGQGVYTIADAMGNAGQRMLSTVARAPGGGRTDVVNALEARQAGQGRRIANTLAEGFNSPQTAAQTEAALTRARDTAADAAYGAVRNDAVPVDLSRTIARIDQTLRPGVMGLARPGSRIADDSVESALSSIRNRLTDGRSVLTEFEAVQRVRGDLADKISVAQRAGEGNKVRLLTQVRNELDLAMERASPGHLAANRNFAAASRNIEAVDQGRTASLRGRTEDTIPQFQALPQEGQSAFRSGYVDPLIAQTQSAAFGANKARPLINDAFQSEARVMAPGNDLMQRRIAREQAMFETRNHALGGSRTADNLADQAATGVDPHLIGQVVTGNWHGALRSVLSAGSNILSGNTPAVRQEIANILLQRGHVAPARLSKMVQDTVDRIQFIQNMARNLGRGASGGLAIAAPTRQR